MGCSCLKAKQIKHIDSKEKADQSETDQKNNTLNKISDNKIAETSARQKV